MLGEQNADTMRDSVRGIDQRRPLKQAVGRAHQPQHVLDAVPGHGEQHRIAPDGRLTRRDGEHSVPQPLSKLLRLDRRPPTDRHLVPSA